MYSDGSGFEGGIGASTLLYINKHLVKTLWVYLSTALEHTVYEAEGSQRSLWILLVGVSIQVIDTASSFMGLVQINHSLRPTTSVTYFL